MARSPSAKVPSSSGQGVSRYSYQRGYELGNRGTGGAADFRIEHGSKRDYGKSTPKRSDDRYVGSSVDAPYQVGNLSALNEVLGDAPPRPTVRHAQSKPRVMK